LTGNHKENVKKDGPGSCPNYACREMLKPVPGDPALIALRSLIWRVVVFFLAGLAVIAAFVVAWRVGAFAPARGTPQSVAR
jgi:hypothetical protein